MRSDRRPPKDLPPRDEGEQDNAEGYEVGLISGELLFQAARNLFWRPLTA